MKKYIYLAFVVLMASSCESYLNINEDPNNPTSVPVTSQVAAIQLNLVDVTNGAFSRFSCMLTQQVEGVARQWSSFNQYSGLQPNRFDAAWDNIYENTLNEIKNAKINAEEAEFNHHLGVLKAIEAYTLYMASDVWGAMPYTEAFAGLENLNPQYETQTEIYAIADNLLNEAEMLLNGTPGRARVGSEDILYGGDIDLWKLAIKGIRARTFLKLKNYSGAMAEAEKSFTEASQNLKYTYSSENAANWFRFNRDRTGDLEFHPTMRAIMQSYDDTLRLARFDQVFDPSNSFITADYTQDLLSYRELQFIIAEAEFRGNGSTEKAYTAYQNGIKASFTFAGLSEEDFMSYWGNASVGVGEDNLTLELIMDQKYLAMFLQPETYSDFRRTGFPSLTPVSGPTIPVRWHYPSDEFLYNSNAPNEQEVDIFNDLVDWNR